ncbi:MAG: hypothetical protein IIV02_06025 [Peptococcaceae bacterium]|nr:hypothetical protein [Peptococcaceae bacterium]
MMIAFTDEEHEWLEKDMFNWHVKSGAPIGVKKSIERKLQLLGGEIENRPVAKTFSETIEKFNPYHDKRGRFTNASGATSFTIRTRAGYNQGMADKAIEREKKRTGGDGAAKIKSAEDDLRAVLKEGAVVKFDGMDPEMAQETTAEIKKVLDKYPSCKDAFAGFTTDDTDRATFTDKDDVMACFDVGTKMIHLNNKFYGDKVTFDAKVKASIEKQFHPVGTDYNSVVVHEMGHAIDRHVSLKVIDPYRVMWGGETVSSRIWNSDIKAAKKKGEPMTGKSIRENLSGYASKNPGEYFAEGFAEALCSPTPRKTAQSILKRAETYINKAAKKDEENKWLGGLM